MKALERDLREMFARHEADLRGPRFAPTRAPLGVAGRVRRLQARVALAGVILVAAIAGGVAAGASSLLRSSGRQTPAIPIETPTPIPSLDAPIRPSPQRYPIAVVKGDSGGVPWSIWANADLNCIAFTTPYGSDQGCSGALGPDVLEPPRAGCEWRCPTVVLYGLVTRTARSVELVLDDGTRYVGTIHPEPPGVDSDARLYTVMTDRLWGTFTGSVWASDQFGTTLGRVRVPITADAAGAFSMPMTVEAVLASGVPTSAIDGTPADDGRWELAVWRNAAGGWCLGTIYPSAPRVVIATETSGCQSRASLFGSVRIGAIGHADIWWASEAEMFHEEGTAEWMRYRVAGTVSPDVTSVRVEVSDGQIIEADVYDPPAGFEDLGRVFVGEFRSRLYPWWYEGLWLGGGISWRAIALGPDGVVVGLEQETAADVL